MVDTLKQRRQAVTSLMHTDGWTLMKQVFNASAEHEYKAMMATGIAHDSAKHMGAFHVSRQVATWPERELEMIDNQLRAILER